MKSRLNIYISSKCQEKERISMKLPLQKGGKEVKLLSIKLAIRETVHTLGCTKSSQETPVKHRESQQNEEV